jgi:hypothetical protein
MKVGCKTMRYLFIYEATLIFLRITQFHPFILIRGYAMSTHKIIARSYTGWILGVVVLALFAHASISQGAGQLLAWPADEGVMQFRSTAEPLKSYEVRKGRIALSPEILPGSSGAVNRQVRIAASKSETDTASISLFADVAYEVIIDSVKHHADGTTIVNGKLKDHTMGTVVMTIGPDGFLITVQDMKKGLLYRVAGDSRQGSGTVTEIDMKKMPPVVR